MKALLVIAHYFKPEPASAHSSTREGLQIQRRRALEQVFLSWSGQTRETATLDIATRSTRIAPGALGQLDIAVVVDGDRHLLDARLQQTYGLRVIRTQPGDSRLLPFMAHRVMADHATEYDWFIYSEDDLALRDPYAFTKLQWFQKQFGPDHVLQPNRFELSPVGVRHKTYIDGDLRPGLIEPLLARRASVPDRLEFEFLNHQLMFVRARNPHSGCFALTAGQLDHWMRQAHFLDRDCSFISPLESAATLGIVKTFGVFKASAPDQGWFEIEHLDNKFSQLRLPLWTSTHKASS